MTCLTDLSEGRSAAFLCALAVVAQTVSVCAKADEVSVVIAPQSPTTVDVELHYGDSMSVLCQKATAFIPSDFKTKCCNAYGAICSPGQIESHYTGMFPLAGSSHAFWKGGDGITTPAKFVLPPETKGNRYETRFSLGCRNAQQQLSVINVTIAASTYVPGSNKDDATRTQKPVTTETPSAGVLGAYPCPFFLAGLVVAGLASAV
ncbi:SAG-related sequence SRS67 [Besnoitia besnoiti]|uniref:SAG-related sequence SRS67 n=1 Tax=Besnoitia besnoiti TaxID=94643 RepID=A0A2A9MHM0_BESBE|nr:SAG-related sequence SRS67 [Besnoitia besnoiti]PFH35087.1 SAG-related sequence SRS67 [Besnoitia besnoiti]